MEIEQHLNSMPAFFNAISHFLSNAFLLDAYPNASAAYSVRKLRDAYSGSCLRVRRASDNTEQDIGFSGNDINESSLTSFCTGTNCFVRTWYDQSGGGVNAVQTTTTRQPKIYDSVTGVLKQNGKVRVDFDGTNDGMTFTSVNMDGDSFFSVFTTNDNGVNMILATNDGLTYDQIRTSSNSYEYARIDNPYFGPSPAGAAVTVSTSVSTSQHLFYMDFGSSNLTGAVDGVNGTSHSKQNSNPVAFSVLGALRIGLGGQDYFNGRVQEVILYNGSKSSDQSGVESNINSYYSIY